MCYLILATIHGSSRKESANGEIELVIRKLSAKRDEAAQNSGLL